MRTPCGPSSTASDLVSPTTAHLLADKKMDTWRFDWERPHVEGMEDLIFKNTFKDIKTILEELGAHGTRFELECYDVGHLYTLAHFGIRHPGRDGTGSGKRRAPLKSTGIFTRQ